MTTDIENLRDKIAIASLKAMLSHPESVAVRDELSDESINAFVSDAYRFADAMLKQREAK